MHAMRIDVSLRTSHRLVLSFGVLSRVVGAILVLFWLADLTARPADAMPWESLSDGFAITTWAPGMACSEEVSAVMVRIDPELFEFSVHHFRDDGLNAPVTLAEWQRRTGAALLFNAGLFLEDFSYMGLLYKNGLPLNRKRHPHWQGLFVAEPVERGMRRARILDLAVDPFPEDLVPYREAAQALMVLDRSGKVRVRQSGKRAQQTLVAEDATGYVYVMKTVSAASLFGLGDCARQTMPWLQQVMAMDGGSSSDLVLGAEVLAQGGRGASVAPWRAIVDGTAPATHIPLPTVIAVTPRTAPRTQSRATPDPHTSVPR